MIRLTLLLALGLWLAFSLAPEPQAAVDAEPAEPVRNSRGDIREVTLETGEVWQVDRVISPGPAPETEAAPSVATPSADSAAPDQAQSIADAEVLRLFVTGTRVNLRAGPSTDNAIVAALTLGTATEFIAEAPGGWYEIRDPVSGVTGFMSGDFLSPTQP